MAVAAGLGGATGLGTWPGTGAQEIAPARPADPGQTSAQPDAPRAPSVAETVPQARADRVGGPAEAAVRGATPEVAAAPQRPGPSVGDRVRDGMDRLQEGDRVWRTGEGGRPAPAREPTLKVAAREPGPAAAQIKGDPAQGVGHPASAPGQGAHPSFDGMLRQLERVSGQVIQVSLVSKTTSSFTGALNKLLSSS